MSSKEKKSSVFTKMLINEKVPLEFKYVNKLLTNNLLEYLVKKFEGKCCDQGYIKPNSINIINYSSGLVKNNMIIFDVVFESLICYLVEGVELNCIAKNITKAGIRAELDMDITPVIIFIARDHHYSNKMFSDVKEGSNILVKIIGQRYELNDTNVSAIAELLKVSKVSKKIQIEEEDSLVKSKSKSESSRESYINKADEAVKTSESVVKSESIDPIEKKEKSPIQYGESSNQGEKSKLIESKPLESKPVESKPVESKAVEEVKSSSKEEVTDVIDEDEQALQALNALEQLKPVEEIPDKKEESLPGEKEITIIPDTQVPEKRKRGRPKKIK